MAQTFPKIIKLSIIFLLILACSEKQEEINNASNGLRSNSPELRNITKMQNDTRIKIIKSIR